MKVPAIPGSLRSGSVNRALLRAAQAAAPEGAEIELRLSRPPRESVLVVLAEVRGLPAELARTRAGLAG